MSKQSTVDMHKCSIQTSGNIFIYFNFKKTIYGLCLCTLRINVRCVGPETALDKILRIYTIIIILDEPVTNLVYFVVVLTIFFNTL